MFGVFKHERGAKVAPLKIVQIREVALRLRAALDLPTGKINYAPLLDILSEEYGINYDILEDDHPHLDGAEARYLPQTAIILFSETTYSQIYRNEGRGGFTLFHELGHVSLGHENSVVFNRGMGLTLAKEAYEDAEWQADRFAGEVLMPLSIMMEYELFSAQKLVAFFGVSKKAAERRIRDLKRSSEI